MGKTKTRATLMAATVRLTTEKALGDLAWRKRPSLHPCDVSIATKRSAPKKYDRVNDKMLCTSATNFCSLLSSFAKLPYHTILHHC